MKAVAAPLVQTSRLSLLARRSTRAFLRAMYCSGTEMKESPGQENTGCGKNLLIGVEIFLQSLWERDGCQVLHQSMTAAWEPKVQDDQGRDVYIVR